MVEAFSTPLLGGVELRPYSPIWSCSGRGLPCRELLPVARCALTAPFHPYQLLSRRFVFCGTFRGLAPPRRYLAPCPKEPGLSSVTQGVTAIAWPTPAFPGPILHHIGPAGGRCAPHHHGSLRCALLPMRRATTAGISPTCRTSPRSAPACAGTSRFFSGRSLSRRWPRLACRVVPPQVPLSTGRHQKMSPAPRRRHER